MKIYPVHAPSARSSATARLASSSVLCAATRSSDTRSPFAKTSGCSAYPFPAGMGSFQKSSGVSRPEQPRVTHMAFSKAPVVLLSSPVSRAQFVRAPPGRPRPCQPNLHVLYPTDEDILILRPFCGFLDCHPSSLGFSGRPRHQQVESACTEGAATRQ